jgi:serine/threonine-protein kinase
VRVIGRYALYDEIAAGGMATVHLGRLTGQAGFSRTVAIKRLHVSLAKDPDFVAMFMDEARLAGRIHHPNVASTLDVVAREGELFLVMEYILGESLWRLLRQCAEIGERVEPRIGAAIVVGLLHGLHAAHEAHSEHGEPLEIVHRDVSPQNVLVGIDGVPRVVDFGIAKAAGRAQATREGQLKGKLPYMAPEQLQGLEVTRRTDIYAASIVLWELLTGKRLFARENDAAVMLAVLTMPPPPPSAVMPGIPTALDRIALRGLSRSPDARFRTARDMALDLEASLDLALPSEVGAWVQKTAGTALMDRATRVAEIERSGIHVLNSGSSKPPPHPNPEDSRTLTAASAADLPPSTSSSTRGKLAFTLLVSLVFAALVLIAGRTILSPSPTHVVVGAPATTAIEPIAPPPPSVPELAVDSLPSAAQVEAAPSAAPAPTAAAPTAHTTSAQATRHATTAAAKCDPPYRVDAAGHKIFKIECL